MFLSFYYRQKAVIGIIIRGSRHNFVRQTRTTTTMTTPLEEAKKRAAYHAIDAQFQELSQIRAIGIGSGSTIVYAVERLAQIVQKDPKLMSIACVPTSFQAKQLITKHKLVLSDLEQTPQLDFAIDGADEVDPQLTLIKGGGGCLAQEKIVASAAKKLVIVADNTKNSEYLGQKWKKGLPIEVLPMAYSVVRNAIESRFGGIAELRMAKAKAGPLVTDNGNFILDWKFDPNSSKNWTEIDPALNNIPGVVETGLFVGMASKVYLGDPNNENVTVL